MRVRYRANDEIRDVSEEAGRVLVEAGIADPVEPSPPKGKKAR